MANRLSTATSPYLLQHADNPVDWWPWGEEAFAEARRRDVPVFISVGYAACHWCHVMAHESFEDPEVAAIVNEHVVAIKVDREERPDVDAVYMSATQAMTGQGGWPMTVFTTPDGAPLYCGTYFQKPHFARLVQAVARAWVSDREALLTDSERTVAALAAQANSLAGIATTGQPVEALEPATVLAVTGLEAGYDSADGGFGGAPKFPPSMVLEFLLRHYQRTGPASQSGQAALQMAAGTCEAMASGGMYDQLGGGFARYSVDGTWTVPHFEKMLYDNALLAAAYTHWWRLTGNELARRIAEETCDFMVRELRTPEGGFAASLDADSVPAKLASSAGTHRGVRGVVPPEDNSVDASGHAEEGAFYVWTPAQLRDVLGPDDGEFAIAAFGVTTQGTFEHGTSVLQRRNQVPDTERLDRIRGTLLTFRDGRPRPSRDDKVVAAWNGMTIGVLAEAGVLFGRPDLVSAATQAAQLLLAVHLTQPTPAARLMRTSRHGRAGTSAGQLEDYACVAAGLLTLFGVTGDARWATVAGELLETVLAQFPDGNGGFFDTPADGEQLIYRPADALDGPTPSGTFAAAGALASLAALTGSVRYREAAIAALGVVSAIASKYPRAAGHGLATAEALLSGPIEIAIVGAADDPRTGALLRAALHAAPGGAVLALGAEGAAVAAVPLLADRTLVSDAPAAYVCQGFTCQLPVTTPAGLREQLSELVNGR
jgi:uncharacterized protein YyaL (SSP411 family)